MTVLARRLRPVQARMALNRFLADAATGLALGWGAAALLVLAHRLFYLPFPLGWIPWAATAAPLAGAALGAWLRRASLREAAVLADERLGLAERLSSALLVEGATPMEQAVQADADLRLQRLVPRAACPLVLPKRRAWGALAALALLAGAGVMKDLDLLGRRKARDDRDKVLAEVKTAGKILEQKVQKLQEEAKARGMEAGEIGKGLEELAAQLKDGIQDPKAALAEINDLQARMKEEASHKDREKAAQARDLQKALEAAKTPGGARADSLKDMIQDLRDMAQKAAEGKASPEDVAEMQKALSSLAEALGKTEASRELAAELSRAAQALEQQKDALPQMGDNLKNLADQLAQMDKALDREQMMEMAKAELESLKQQLGGQDPWEGKVSEEDRQAFEQKMQELAQAGET